MRSTIATICSLILALPLVFTAPVHAQTRNDTVGGTVQRFLGNGNSADQDRAYEQGRRDQGRRDDMQSDRGRGYGRSDSRYSSDDPRHDTNPRYDNNRSSRY